MAALIEKGDVRFVYQHRLVVDPTNRSQLAAEAAECAADQSKFWDMHNKLYKEQGNKNTWSAAVFKSYAKAIGLDEAAFGSCMDSRKHKATVAKSDSEAAGKGVNSTPTFFINGKVLTLKQSFSEVLQAVNKELNK